MAKFLKLVSATSIYKQELGSWSNKVEQRLGIEHAQTNFGDAAVGDFNGDGYQDIISVFYGHNHDGEVYNGPTDGKFVLLLGTKGGGFKNGAALLPDRGEVNGSIGKLDAGDFNGDGVDDVVLVNSFEDGRENATDDEAFAAPQFMLASNNGKLGRIDLGFSVWGHGMTTGDYNSDGREDFVVTGYNAPVGGHSTGAFVQGDNGALETHWIDDFGGSIVNIGDFDGDGRNEIADWWAKWGESGPEIAGMRVTEINDDGSLGVSHLPSEPIARNEMGIGWNGAQKLFQIMVDNDGNEFIDQGVHFSDAGDINGDGRDDIVGIRFASELKYNANGLLTEQGKPRTHIECFTLTDTGMERMDVRIEGWTYPKDGLYQIKLIDWNGDGHLDMYTPWPGWDRNSHSVCAQVFINDGTGNFIRLSQKYIPQPSNDFGMIVDPVDINGDDIMDFVMRPSGFDDSWLRWGKKSEWVYEGTRRIFGDGTSHNPATDGAAGFNAAYYLGEIESSAKMLKSSGFVSALDHYLEVGRPSGVFGFAAGTHVYGYRGSETIVLREGNESVDASGGDDIITGAGGADTLNGGKGADTFVYMAVTDTGVTLETCDLIEDFESGTDKIDLSGVDAIAGTPLNDAFAFITAAGALFTGKAGEVRWFSVGSGTDASRIIEGDIDGDAVADFQIELLGGGSIAVEDLTL